MDKTNPDLVPDTAADNTAPDAATIDDAALADAPINPPTAEVDEPDEPVRRASPADDRRLEIAKRAREAREREGNKPFEGNVFDPTALFGRHATQPPVTEPDPPAVQEPDPAADADAAADANAAEEDAPPPKTYKLTVRGKVREVTEEEYHALAQKAAAADDYLDEIKRDLREVKALKESLTRQHQADPPSPHAEADVPSNRRAHSPEDLEKDFETIQFGDPKEAAPKFIDIVDKRAEDRARAVLIEDRFRSDENAAAAALQSFQKNRADIASDPMLRSLVETMVFEEYREDFRRLGLDEDKIANASPADIAKAHRLFRVEGHPVRPVSSVLDAAAKRVDDWLAARSPKPAPTPPTPVQMQDRAERKRAIPPQPPRANVPPQVATPPSTGRPVNSVVMQMRKSRGQTVA